MGQAKIKRRAGFSESQIRAWESDACVNFAVALARLTDWLLHVDWWWPSTDPDAALPVERLTPLRVYVADNHDQIFDVHGVRSIVQFNDRTIRPIIRRLGPGGVRTRYYSEADLFKLPLHSLPEEPKIAAATEAIGANQTFLSSIPRRSQSHLPAHEAARFTFGLCAVFAQALHEYTGAEPVGLLTSRFAPYLAGTAPSESGYFHSVVLHQDGSAEDSWGKAPLEEIATRFGAMDLRISRQEHQNVIANLRRHSAEQFDAALQDARALIQTHRRRQASGSTRGGRGE